jgi:hypothetical protein
VYCSTDSAAVFIIPPRGAYTGASAANYSINIPEVNDMPKTNEEYARMVKAETPPSPVVKNCLLAFLTGGAICAAGQGITELWLMAGLARRRRRGRGIDNARFSRGLPDRARDIRRHREIRGGRDACAHHRLREFHRLAGARIQKRGLYPGHEREDVHHRGAGACLRHLGVRDLRARFVYFRAFCLNRYFGRGKFAAAILPRQFRCGAPLRRRKNNFSAG